MGGRSRVHYTWKGAAEALERQAEANARADAAWLRSLTIEDSVRILEDLCRGIPEVGTPHSDTDPPPVILFRMWGS